mmetsp:Transcript_12944/g.23491  ORF Transcript_12944/g.23491 Transcript_12944/m.23491 type:complete len:316 (+) Transcript_12944:1931-2878(+)
MLSLFRFSESRNKSMVLCSSVARFCWTSIFSCSWLARVLSAAICPLSCSATFSCSACLRAASSFVIWRVVAALLMSCSYLVSSLSCSSSASCFVLKLRMPSAAAVPVVPASRAFVRPSKPRETTSSPSSVTIFSITVGGAFCSSSIFSCRLSISLAEKSWFFDRSCRRPSFCSRSASSLRWMPSSSDLTEAKSAASCADRFSASSARLPASSAFFLNLATSSGLPGARSVPSFVPSARMPAPAAGSTARRGRGRLDASEEEDDERETGFGRRNPEPWIASSCWRCSASRCENSAAWDLSSRFFSASSLRDFFDSR